MSVRFPSRYQHSWYTIAFSKCAQVIANSLAENIGHARSRITSSDVDRFSKIIFHWHSQWMPYKRLIRCLSKVPPHTSNASLHYLAKHGRRLPQGQRGKCPGSCNAAGAIVLFFPGTIGLQLTLLSHYTRFAKYK